MYQTLCSNGALPIYAIYMIVHAIFLILTVLRLWYVKDKPEPDTKNEEKKIKKSLVQRFYEQEEFKFMVCMDRYPDHTYHIGK